MRFLITLPLVALASCGSYYSDIPNNDPSYLPAEQYVEIGRAHVKKAYPEFKLRDKQIIDLGFHGKPKPRIKRKTSGQILDNKVYLIFSEYIELPKKLLIGTRSSDHAIRRSDVSIWLNSIKFIDLTLLKNGKVTTSEIHDWNLPAKPTPASQAPLSKRPKLTN